MLINPLLQHSLGFCQVTSSVFTGLLSLNPGEVDPGLQELVTTQAASVKPVIYNNLSKQIVMENLSEVRNYLGIPERGLQ